MHILLVEDDHLQAEALEGEFKKAFCDAQVQQISTESAFRAWVERAAPPFPNIFVIDMMLRWSNPAPTIPEPPEEVKRNGRYRAGERCRALLLNHPVLWRIPVILHTVLERSEIIGLPETIEHVTKESNTSELLRRIKVLVQAGSN